MSPTVSPSAVDEHGDSINSLKTQNGALSILVIVLSFVILILCICVGLMYFSKHKRDESLRLERRNKNLNVADAHMKRKLQKNHEHKQILHLLRYLKHPLKEDLKRMTMMHCNWN